MNWRMTAVLFAVVVLLGGYLYYQNQQEPTIEPVVTQEAPAPERVALVNSTIDQVQRLEITRLDDGTTASYFRDALGSWLQIEPPTAQIITQTINTQVIGLVNLSSNRSLPAGLNPLSSYGLDAPTYEIVLAAEREPGKIIRHTFFVGNDVPTGSAIYIQKRGDSRIHIVPRGVIDNMIDLLENPPVPTPSPDLTVTAPLSGTTTLSTTISPTLPPGPEE